MGQRKSKVSTTASASHRRATDSNEVLKLKFKKLHQTVVNNVNAASIMDFLFQEAVIDHDDMRRLQWFRVIRDDTQEQCSELLMMLHGSEHQQAFIQLYAAIKNESHLQWLVERIDKFSDESVIDLLQQLDISEPTVGQVVHTLNEGEVVCGVTSLAGEIYVLRRKERDQVEVYDVITYRLQRCLNVPNARRFVDMTSCEHYCCIYIGDRIAECIHRLDAQGAATQWPVNDEPWGLSVNLQHNLLVTCIEAGEIKEFTTDGHIVRTVDLPGDVIHPCHTVQTRSGQFIVCHGSHLRDDAVHGVCVISADGRHIVHSHGGQPGSVTDDYDGSVHLAVDNDEFVFVVDVYNRRVTLLSPTLHYVGQVVSSDQLKWWPLRMYLDTQKRFLYVADNQRMDNEYVAGRVVVFSV